MERKTAQILGGRPVGYAKKAKGSQGYFCGPDVRKNNSTPSLYTRSLSPPPFLPNVAARNDRAAGAVR